MFNFLRMSIGSIESRSRHWRKGRRRNSRHRISRCSHKARCRNNRGMGRSGGIGMGRSSRRSGENWWKRW
jgi:hypothetical protein